MTFDFLQNNRKSFTGSRELPRILFLSGLLVLIFIAMRIASRPATWSWMSESSPSIRQELPTSITEPHNHTVSATHPARLAVQPVKPIRPTVPMRSSNSLTHQQSNVEVSTPQLGIKERETLKDVRDNSALRLRPQEANAYYTILDHARKQASISESPAARADVTFAMLLNDPSSYRGELVRIEGIARRTTQYNAGSNSVGIDQLYESWIFSPDSQNHPYIVVSTRIPSGFPLGTNISEAVSVTGYFFKNNLYAARDAMRIAPMLLSSHFVWQHREATATGYPKGILPLLFLTGLAVVIAIYWMIRPRKSGPADPQFTGIPTDASDPFPDDISFTQPPEKQNNSTPLSPTDFHFD